MRRQQNLWKLPVGVLPYLAFRLMLLWKILRKPQITKIWELSHLLLGALITKRVYCGFIPLQDPAHHLVSRIPAILGLWSHLSGSTVNIAGINVADGKSITASTWDESVDVSREHKGLWLNLDSKLNSNGINLQNVSIQLPLRQIDLDTVNTNIKNNDKWGYLTNCSTFASKIWNSIASGSSKVDAGSINTPASLAKSITKVGEAESYTLLKYNTSSPHYDSVYYGYPPIKSNNNN